MTGVPADVQGFRERVEAELHRSVAERRRDLEWRDPDAAFLVDELLRLIEAGGSRLRPVCCYLGFRAGGGVDGLPIVRAGAALEFLHLMALVHDDVMDDAKERRGVPTTHRQLADLTVDRGGDDPDHVGRSLAILVGDLAGVCADLSFAEAGFAPARLARALDRYHSTRLDMAAGQALDVLGHGDPGRVATLKGGSYSIAGPLLFGAALGGASPAAERVLDAVGAPLGTAFQLRDDLRDGDAAAGVDRSTVVGLVDRARRALTGAPFDARPLAALVDSVEAP